MSFARVKLHNLGVSRERSEVPVFSSEALQLYYGTETQYSTRVFEKVKVRRSLEPQAIELPISDLTSLLDCDVCSFAYYYYNGSEDMAINEQDLQWFYITGYEEITYKGVPPSSADMNVRLYLEPIPVTSYMTQETKFDILPERMPSATAHVRQNWTQSIMQTAAATTPISANIGQIISSDDTYTNQNVFWAEIDYTGFNGTTPDGLPIGDNKIRRVGVFVTGEGGTRMQSPVPPTGSATNSYRWMLLDELIQDPLGALGLTGTVCAINVSQFCPYAVLKSGTEYSINMNLSTPLMPGSLISGTTYRAYYDIDSLTLNYQQVTHNHKNITITLTDFEKENGQVVIRDQNRNVIMDIPVEKNTTTMTITEDTFADVSGIYTRFACGDSCIIHNGTSLPWGTSAWEQYRTYNMAYDRQALQNNIDSAYRSMNVTVLNGVSNAVIGGGIAGGMKGGAGAGALGVSTGLASAGSSIIGGALQTKYAIKEARAEQDLTEQRMRGSPMTANNLAAGTNYIIQIHRFGGCSISLMMPAGFTETEWTAQTAIWGYPSNKVLAAELVFSAGYWKGRVTAFLGLINNANSGDNGIQIDRIVSQIENGIRIKIINS